MGSTVIRMLTSHCLRNNVGIAEVGNALGLVSTLQHGASQYAECVADCQCQALPQGISGLSNSHIGRADHAGEPSAGSKFACVLLNPFAT